MDPTETTSLRITVLAVFVFCSISILTAYLASLQIIHKQYFDDLALENRTRLVPDPPPRGQLLDRNKNMLAKVKFSYNVSVFKEDVETHKSDIRTFLQSFSAYLSNTDFNIEKAEEFPVNPVPLAQDLDMKALTQIKENLHFSFLVIQRIPQRTYPHGSTASHLLGTMGEIPANKLKYLKEHGYRMGDKIGLSGIEAYYDRLLKGKEGGRQVEVDARGTYIKTLSYRPPVSGKNLMLSVDKKLQKIVEAALAGKKGAIVVLDPKTYRILALASSPSYSPEDFASGLTQQKWRAIAENPGNPLLNRAVSGAYPPGSVFKLVTAIAALEEGIVSPGSIFYCPGGYKLGNRTFRCWKRSGHGHIDFIHGIAQSCDVVFYTLAEKLGVEKLEHYAKLMGIGQKTGVDLPGEKTGLLPSPAWKKKRFRDPWFPGDTANMGIGQGFLQTTPLQMAKIVAFYASGGFLGTPHFLVGAVSSSSHSIEKLSSFPLSSAPFNQKNIHIVIRGMEEVVKHGTGGRAYIPECEGAGKTGTAEDPPRKKPHAWFVGFAPVNNPKVAVSVFIESGGKGSEAAAPLAKKVFAWACGISLDKKEKQALKPLAKKQ